MSSGILLFVGLGNPGAEYEHTRHNAGAWFVQHLAHEAQVTLRHVVKFHGLHATATLYGQDCHLLIPTTFMNLSGQAVSALSNYYKVPPAQILIAHDEIDLPPGEIRLKWEGGHGGHNGLRDIIQHTHTNQFYRLRLGVGHPGNSKLVHDYVLNPPRKAEQDQINHAIHAAQQVTPLLLSGDFQKAMMELHTKRGK